MRPLYAALLLAVCAHGGPIMTKIKPVRAGRIEARVRVSQSVPAGPLEILSEEIIALSAKEAGGEKILWSYLPSTLPKQPASRQTGEFTPVCLRFTALAVRGGVLTAAYRQGFIRADAHGITRLEGDFEDYQNWAAEIDLKTGKELSVKRDANHGV